MNKIQSNWNYVPVVLVLSITYYLCFDYALGIHYHDYLETLLVGKSRYYAIAFIVGALGANVQMSIHFSLEINAMLQKPEDHIAPSVFEFFGYLLKSMWGGIAGVIFILAVKSGFLATFEGNQDLMNIEAMSVIAFVVGLRAFQILKRISQIIK